MAPGRASAAADFAEVEIDSEIFSDHLQRALFAGQNRESQDFLTIYHALDRGTAVGLGQKPLNLDDAADVIRVVLYGNG